MHYKTEVLCKLYLLWEVITQRHEGTKNYKKDTRYKGKWKIINFSIINYQFSIMPLWQGSWWILEICAFRILWSDSMELFHLPPYSPAFNAQEKLWEYTRKQATQNRHHETETDLCAALTHPFDTMQNNPELIISFVAQFCWPICLFSFAQLYNVIYFSASRIFCLSLITSSV